MASDAIISALEGAELFEGLSPPQLAAIAHRAERIVFKPGSMIIEDGTAGDAAYLLVAGESVRLASPVEARAVESIPPRSIVGEMAMLIEVEHSSTIAALSQVRALKLSRAALHELMAEDPTLADHLVSRIALRLHGVLTELAAIDAISVGRYRDADMDVTGMSLH